MSRKVIEALQEAPVTGEWPRALTLMADAFGGWGCCLVSSSPSKGMLARALGRITEEHMRAAVGAGALDPASNLRLQVVRANGLSTIASEADIPDPAAWLASRYYNEFALPVDAPYSMFARLGSNYDEVTTASIWRSRRQGAPDAEELARFAAILPALSDAVTLQLELDRRAFQFSAHSWDHTNTPAFYCDPHLRVLAMSAAAEMAASKSEFVSLRRNHLQLVAPRHQRRLARSVSAACRCYDGPTSKMIFEAPSVDGSATARFAVAPVREENVDAFRSPAALVLLLDEGRADITSGARREVSLTNAEENIARGLLSGLTTRQIAEARGSSIATVQTQVKVLNQKLSAKHRAALLARLRTILGED
ncbi:MAG: helix-turn-helix transcriptional regulator [Parvularculaceae bacterium]